MTRTDGERWARDSLDALRAARFTPRATAHFLADAQRRTYAQRAARPIAAARIRAWGAIGAAAWLVPPARPHARTGLPAWGLTVLMLDWHVGMFETEDGHPRDPGAADALTLLRAWLIPVAARRPRPTVLAVAFATDVLDGVLARATAPTRAGRDLEGLVDAVFGAAVLRGLQREGRLGRTVAGAEVARLAAGLTYAVVAWFGTDRPPDPAVLRAGRISTPLRAAGLLTAAAGHRRTGELALAAGSAVSVAAVIAAVSR